MFYCLIFFFFKQKTAYDMRIRDWSSDVCSSDLVSQGGSRGGRTGTLLAGAYPADRCRRRAGRQPALWRPAPAGDCPRHVYRAGAALPRRAGRGPQSAGIRRRSEEHTSELQSLMRTSYAVFCLKKKKNKKSETKTQ